MNTMSLPVFYMSQVIPATLKKAEVEKLCGVIWTKLVSVCKNFLKGTPNDRNVRISLPIDILSGRLTYSTTSVRLTNKMCLEAISFKRLRNTE